MTTHEPEIHRLGIADLLRLLREETARLLRDEVALAKQEAAEKASLAGRNAAYVVAGGLVAYTGAIIIVLGIVTMVYGGLVNAGVGQVAAAWTALLSIGAIIAIVGVTVAVRALSTLRRMRVVPERTVATLQDNTEWIGEKVSR